MSIWGAGISAVVGIGTSIYQGKQQAKADRRSAEANYAAIAESNRIMEEATGRASEAISAGEGAAAAAIIQAGKQAAKAALDNAQLSVDAQERFFAVADEKLEPFRQQGLVAQDELASMLGIPNSDGVLVPYDLDKLRATPGYEFRFQEGQTMVERSAVGTKLSGAQAKAQTQYGQQLADTYFDKQVGYLQNLHNVGATAAGQQADNAIRTGQGIGSTYNALGSNLASIYSAQGGQLAGAYSAAAGAQAGLIGSLANSQMNAQMAGAGTQSSLYANQAQRRSDTAGAIAGALGEFGTAVINRPKKRGTTSSGGGQA